MARFDLAAGIVDFSAHHRSRANRVCHYFGLPAISAAVLGLLARVAWPVAGVAIDMGMLLLLGTLLLDLMLNARIAVGVLALGTALYLCARPLPLEALGALFAVGWIFQLVGHRLFEKNAPAFVKNMVHLFIGPRWMVNRVVRALPETPAAAMPVGGPVSHDAAQ